MIVKCLDIVKQRLKFSLILVKAMLFWTIWRKSNNFMCYCWWLPSLLPLSNKDWNSYSFWWKLWYFEKFVEEPTILCLIVDGSPFSSPCYLWYSNEISTSVKSITIQKKTTKNQYKSTISFLIQCLLFILIVGTELLNDSNLHC